MKGIMLFGNGLRGAFLLECLVLLLLISQATGVWAQNASIVSQDAIPSQPTDSVLKPVVDTPPDETSSEHFKSAEKNSENNGDASSSAMLGAANGDYVLQSGDTIEMVVYREPDLSIRSKIGQNDMVELPLLGNIKLGGLSVQSATSLIREKYNAHYLVNPQIYLSIVGYNVCKFTIIGQVGKPGTYEFNAGESMDFLEAIGIAGGFTRDADQGRIVIKRHEGNGMRTLKINAKVLSSSSAAPFKIEPGDVITVSESWF